MREKPTDWSLVEQAKAGDDRAFDAIMERYKRPIVGFVYRMVGDAVEAEDVAQDVFVRTYQSMRKPAFRQTTAEFSTWPDFLNWRVRRAETPMISRVWGERSSPHQPA